MTGFPIAFVIGSVSFLVGLAVFGPTTTFHILYSRFFDLSLNYPYLAVPLFTFMGVILQHSGITKDLYECLYEALGRLMERLSAEREGVMMHGDHGLRAHHLKSVQGFFRIHVQIGH